MRIGVAQWENRIAPVFDVADNLSVIDIEDGREVRREKKTIVSRNPFQRATEVSALGVDLLVCGAISSIQEAALARTGVQVAGFVCGEVEDVVHAILAGRLNEGPFLMPGRRGHRQRHRSRGGRGGPWWAR